MHRLLKHSANTLRLLSLRNRYQGEQAVVMCPGGSLDQVDLSLLQGHRHLQGTNGFYAKWQAPFRHFFCSSFLFYQNNWQTISDLPCDKWFIATYLKEDPRSESWVWPQKNRTYWMTVDVFIDGPIKINPLRVMPWGPTVLFDLMLPALLWMGYSEIVLLGTDYNAQNYGYCAPEKGDGPTQPSGIELDSRVHEMALAHQRALQWAQWLPQHHPKTRIVNCAPGSQLPGFERARLEDVI